MSARDPLLWPPDDDDSTPEVLVAPGQVSLFSEKQDEQSRSDESQDDADDTSSPREGNDI